jgi:aquaporin Z
MRKYVVEFIGTFFLVLTVGCIVLAPKDVLLGGLAIGSSLMVMIFAGGHISGAHYNPAVTLAVWIRGRCPTVDVPFYMLAQLLGGGAAAYVALFLFKKALPGTEHYPQVDMLDLDVARSMVAEFLYTFALAYVVLNAATAKGTSGNSFYGLAIGFTVVTGAYAVGSISGGAFNPAVAFGLTVMGKSLVTNIWIYWVAELVGGALAGVTYRCLCPEDK